MPRSVLPNAPAKMDVSHIVVKYAGLPRADSITRTREEACLRAQEARDKLLSGGDWDEVYAAYSDSKDAMKGAFRQITQDAVEPVFGKAAFSLKVDELSQVVETENGFHVIWRMQ
ncbi:MAG: peptidylprolyl isomerase [Polyangiaceae bacterium]